MEYTIRFTKTERERHFIYINHRFRNYFPPTYGKFNLKIGKNSTSANIDKKNRLWLRKSNKLINWSSGLLTTIEKNPNGSFSLFQK